jgi:hypothetical protein
MSVHCIAPALSVESIQYGPRPAFEANVAATIVHLCAVDPDPMHAQGLTNLAWRASWQITLRERGADPDPGRIKQQHVRWRPHLKTSALGNSEAVGRFAGEASNA